MTDITELAPAMKAAAEKASSGEWRRASTQFNGITATPFMLGRKEVMIACASEKCDAEFIALANPANVLALVEALEKAQADGNEYAASERAVAVKNVELEDEIYELERRIAELESRTVIVKLPVSLDFDCEMENGDYDIDEEPYLRGKVDGFNYSLTKVRRLNGTTGIKWEAE